MSETLTCDLESVGVESGGREYYAWLRLADGSGALWQLDIRQPPGQMQRLAVIEGA